MTILGELISKKSLPPTHVAFLKRYYGVMKLHSETRFELFKVLRPTNRHRSRDIVKFFKINITTAN